MAIGMRKRDIPILYTADEIQDRVQALAQEIGEKMPADLVIISLLKGGFMFTADLVRELYAIGIQPQIDFLTLSSYGAGAESSKQVTMNRELTDDVAGKTVLLVDDILESGRTLCFARNLLEEKGAVSVKIAVLLEKPGKRDMAVSADFVGFVIPDRFVVGYGLDYANHYRELPYIGYIDVH